MLGSKQVTSVPSGTISAPASYLKDWAQSLTFKEEEATVSAQECLKTGEEMWSCEVLKREVFCLKFMRPNEKGQRRVCFILANGKS